MNIKTYSNLTRNLSIDADSGGQSDQEGQGAPSTPRAEVASQAPAGFDKFQGVNRNIGGGVTGRPMPTESPLGPEDLFALIAEEIDLGEVDGDIGVSEADQGLLTAAAELPGADNPVEVADSILQLLNA